MNEALLSAVRDAQALLASSAIVGCDPMWLVEVLRRNEAKTPEDGVAALHRELAANAKMRAAEAAT